MIDSQTVLFLIDDLQQSRHQTLMIRRAKRNLEHGFLRPLPVILADLANPSQASASFFRLGIDIVANKIIRGDLPSSGRVSDTEMADSPPTRREPSGPTGAPEREPTSQRGSCGPRLGGGSPLAYVR
jgi:hypothetical protein